jgi:hypothetical protein
MKKLTIAAVIALWGSSALAGTDTLVHFANLSPYQATVNFTGGDNSCWYDNGPEDSRIAEYADYFKRNAVSDSSYKGMLTTFKSSFGIDDITTVPTVTMNNTTLALPAATSTKVSSGFAQGETSAKLKLLQSDNCKWVTSMRGFNVTLTGSDGKVLSSQHYVITDPPGDQWTLSRTNGNSLTSVQQTINLGSGGKANAVQIALTAGTVIVTVVSIGTAAPELALARGLIGRVASLWSAEGLGMTFRYVLVGGIRSSATAITGREVFKKGLTSGTTILARVLYTSLANGGLKVYQAQKDSSGKESLTPVTDLATAYKDIGTDFTTPTLAPVAGLPDSRSVCAYQTTTLGIDECRLVGLSVAIMPDGSLTFVPLPSVGSGD